MMMSKTKFFALVRLAQGEGGEKREFQVIEEVKIRIKNRKENLRVRSPWALL